MYDLQSKYCTVLPRARSTTYTVCTDKKGCGPKQKKDPGNRIDQKALKSLFTVE